MNIHKSLRGHLAPLILLAVIPVILFSNTFSNPFIWDDEELIFDDPYIKDLGHLPVILTPKYWKHLRPVAKGEYRPIGIMLFAIDYRFWGVNPAGYHLTNLLIYIFTIIGIYFLIGWLARLKRKKGESPVKNGYERFFDVPFLSALFFAAHPVHVEAVTWIKNRTNLLAMMFVIFSILFFIRHTQRNKKISSSTDFLFSLLFCSLCLMSHEIAVSLPLLLLLYSMCFLPLSRYRKTLIELAPFFFLATFYLLFKILFLGDLVSSVNSPVSIAFLPHLFSVIKTYGQYLWILAFPFNLRAEYIFSIPGSFFDPSVFISALSLLSLIFLAVRGFKYSRLISFSIFWTLITILPASNIVPLTGRHLAEQRLLIPSLGFCLLLSFLLSRTFFSGIPGTKKKSARSAAVISVFLIFFLFSVKTFTRNSDWNHPIGFWIKTVEAAPSCSRAHYNLGVAYLGGRSLLGSALEIHRSETDISNAVKSFNKAIELNPSLFDAYNNLGNIFLYRGDNQKAIELFIRSSQIKPSDPDILTNLGVAYEKFGERSKALSSYLSALKLDPYNAHAYNNLGLLYYENKKIEKALPLFQKAIEIRPDHTAAYVNLANAYNVKGDKKRAIELYERALSKAPDNINALTNLGFLLALTGNKETALILSRQALSFSPLDYASYDKILRTYRFLGENSVFISDLLPEIPAIDNNSAVHAILGKAFSAEKDHVRAREHLKKALTIDPADPEAMLTLGNVYHADGSSDKAIEMYLKAHNIAPENDVILRTLAYAYADINEEKRSFELYLKAVNNNPYNDRILDNMAQFLITTGQEQKAIDTFISLEQKFPESVPVLYNLGNIYTATKKYTDAIPSYRKALEIDNSVVSARKNLAHAYSLSGNPGKAIQLLQKYIQDDPDDLDTYYELANIYNEQGKTLDAAYLYRTVLSSHPSHSGALNNLGVIEAKSGDIFGAIDFFKKAISINPEYEDAYNNLGNAYIALGEKDKTIETYETILKFNPDYAPAYFNLANVYSMTGDKDKALLFYIDAVKKKPDYAMAHSNIAVIYFNMGEYENSQLHFTKAKELGTVNKALDKALEDHKRKSVFGY